MKKSDGYLWVAANGSFVGKVTLPDTTFPVTVTCPSASTSRTETGVQMNLFIKGSAAGTRISGTMTPDMFAGTTLQLKQVARLMPCLRTKSARGRPASPAFRTPRQGFPERRGSVPKGAVSFRVSRRGMVQPRPASASTRSAA